LGVNHIDIPRWKYWLSFIKEVRLEELESEYHSILAINLYKGRYQLCCERAIYSFDDKYDNFGLTFEQLKFDDKWDSLLLLGLGLASIPFLLEKTFLKKYRYTAIEIDEVVAMLAQEYTLSRLDSNVEVVITDAAIYLAQDQQKYDIIAMDIFAEDVIPAKFQTEKYLKLLQSKLKPGGVILYNRLSLTKEDKAESSQFFETFRTVFPDALKLVVKDNWMFISDKRFIK
jgi:predicted membrane-bound spermidine synthase